jgi:hypothetical protein
MILHNFYVFSTDFDRPYPFNDPDEEWIDIKIVII